MRPGLLYSAPVLAEMLGVSATPVREAMVDLAVRGDRAGIEELTRIHLSHTRTIWAARRGRRGP